MIKHTFLLALLAVVLFSCSNEDNLQPETISLKDAESSQFISFEVEGREIYLTDLSSSGRTNRRVALEIDTASSFPISKQIRARFPEDQESLNHYEQFGLVFNHVFAKNELDLNSNKILSDEQFQSEFLNIGKQNVEFSYFWFHQTYRWGYGQDPTSRLIVTDIQQVVGRDDLIFASGEFQGPVVIFKEGEYWTDIKNGKFKVLIEN